MHTGAGRQTDRHIPSDREIKGDKDKDRKGDRMITARPKGTAVNLNPNMTTENFGHCVWWIISFSPTSKKARPMEQTPTGMTTSMVVALFDIDARVILLVIITDIPFSGEVIPHLINSQNTAKSCAAPLCLIWSDAIKQQRQTLGCAWNADIRVYAR